MARNSLIMLAYMARKKSVASAAATSALAASYQRRVKIAAINGVAKNIAAK